MSLFNLFHRDPHEAPARALYAALVAQARQPHFYARWGVPDTLDGRFDLIALHAFLLLHRLQQEHPHSKGLAQALLDTIFTDMDSNLREMGVGDLGVGRRVKRMAQGLYGRIAAYDEALSGPPEALEAALRRNLYGTVAVPDPACVEAMAGYVRAQAAHLKTQDYATLATGTVNFDGPAPAVEDRAGA
ncbi:MAG: hypothetical protein D6826_06210 [Alphaproteobacteria bacterium]|nr:MAG: hypothetical protein D6826_06210 [Alphaproteobacteria bacterium]